MSLGAEPQAKWPDGWWQGAIAVPSPNHGPRPPGAVVSLCVLHSISLPPGVYGGEAIEQLFMNCLDWDAHPYFNGIRGMQVSAHFLIRRDGETRQFVSCDDRAWHAGESCWRGRDNCNDWSIGIELEGLEGDHFEAAQYRKLGYLLRSMVLHYPLQEVVGHEHIAPDRKRDPGPGFDWLELAQEVRETKLVLPP